MKKQWKEKTEELDRELNEDFDEDIEEDYSRYEKKKITKEGIKKGYQALKGQGRIFIYYMIIVIALITVNTLESFKIIPKWVQYLCLITVVGIALFKLSQYHKNDEDDLE